MEWEIFSKVAAEAGIAGVAVLAITFLVLQLTKSHKSELDEIRKERQETHTAFMAFVESNNHQKTELVRESTSAIIEARKAIEIHTELLKMYLNNEHKK